MANSFSVSTYSPSDVVLSISGYTIAGWDSISITRRTDSFKPIYGIRNKHTRVPSGSPGNRDTSAIISLVLAQEAQSNEVLNYVHELDINNGTGRLTLTLKDNSGKSVFSSDEAYIPAYPPVAFTNDFGTRNWRIICQTTTTWTVAGNTKPQTSLLDSAIDKVSGLF